MKKQIIVAIGREHGSGGHYIADMVARELGVKLYDKASIDLPKGARANENKELFEFSFTVGYRSILPWS